MYTEKDIEVITTFYDEHSLQVVYSNLREDAAALLLLSHQALTEALYKIGYANDYDAELIRIPVPTLSDDEGIYNWVTLDDFIHNNSDSHGTLDWRIATDLVLNYKNNTSQPQTSLP